FFCPKEKPRLTGGRGSSMATINDRNDAMTGRTQPTDHTILALLDDATSATKRTKGGGCLKETCRSPSSKKSPDRSRRLRTAMTKSKPRPVAKSGNVGGVGTAAASSSLMAIAASE